MKMFAFKQQKYNPNKLSTISPDTLWLRDIIDEEETAARIADNWIVMESDDFKGWLISQGIDPDKVFV